MIGLVHPGAMGAAVGRALVAGGERVLWCSAGRSVETRRRADAAGLEDAGSLDALREQSGVILSICPPHAAREVARTIAPFDGVYVDANAVSPATARELGTSFDRFVDGGIVGPPPEEPGTTRLYLSGPAADRVGRLFAGSALEAFVLSDRVGDASALKLAYAAWSKGTAAMLLAIRDVARAHDVEQALRDEWELSIPELPALLARAERSAGEKGWRWAGEMDEIAATFAAAGAPDGFHRAAAEVYRR